MAKSTNIINGLDNVAVALRDLNAGETHEGVPLKEEIPKAHKLALRDIEKGEEIKKYGPSIAYATADIPAGSHVHTHNVHTNLSENLEYTYNKVECPVKKAVPRKINVYQRANGDVGIRNELWIIPTVGCVNGQAKRIADTVKEKYGTEGSTAYSCSRTPTAARSWATTTSAPSSSCRRWCATPTQEACSLWALAVKTTRWAPLKRGSVPWMKAA